MKANSPNRTTAGGLPSIDEETLFQIDEEARKLCKGNVALFLHHSALLKGEYRIYCQGEEHFKLLNRVKRLPQYKGAELSVIEGWKKYVENAFGIARKCQANRYSIHRMLILDGCRRAQSDEEAAKIIKDYPNSIRAFAASGDVAFFRHLGRVFGTHSSSNEFDYGEALLNQWLPYFLWLMPEQTACTCLEECRGKTVTIENSGKALRHFKKAKARYALRAHQPSLIDKMQPDGKFILTPKGEGLFRSLIPSK